MMTKIRLLRIKEWKNRGVNAEAMYGIEPLDMDHPNCDGGGDGFWSCMAHRYCHCKGKEKKCVFHSLSFLGQVSDGSFFHLSFCVPLLPLLVNNTFNQYYDYDKRN